MPIGGSTGDYDRSLGREVVIFRGAMCSGYGSSRNLRFLTNNLYVHRFLISMSSGKGVSLSKSS